MTPTIILQTLATIQGEGSSIGEPILLLRTNGCNLKCSFCDTNWANDSYNEIKDFDINTNFKTPYIINNINIHQFIEHLQIKFLNKYKIKRIVFSGGEPLLRIDFIDNFIKLTNNIFSKYEIETNGVLLFDTFYKNILNLNILQLNISPKIIEYPQKYNDAFFQVLKEINKDQLKEYSLITDRFSNMRFKFVYCTDYKDKILNFIDVLKFNNINNEIIISPLTPQHDEKDFMNKYKKSCLDTLEFCLKYGFRYTPREHIFLFGNNRNEFDF